jgi:hypothetical protein
MKKILLTLLSGIFLTGTFAQNAIPNPGFETWNPNPSYDDPQGWGTINGLTYILGVKTVTKTTDKHSGSFAMKLESKTVPLQGVAPGIAATGTINAQTQGVDGGVAFNKRPVAMSGWYKYAPAAVDTGSVEAILTKWSGGQRVEIGRAEFKVSNTVSSYTQFNVNFSYSSSNAPDTLVMIILTSSGANTSPNGTVLFIDDLAFDYCSNFSIAASSSNATCTATDGSVTVSNTNGQSPFTYAWSGGGSGATETKAAGTYTVTVTDANGCSLTASTTVSANSVALGITASATATACGSNTGTATASTTDGTAPYNYLWSNNANTQNLSSLGAGNYTVTITDSKGCSGTAGTSVTTPNGPSATAAVTDVLCFGDQTGAVNVNVTGGTAPLTFTWSNNATTEDISGLASGSYTLTVTDNNSCSFVVNATIQQPTAAGGSFTNTPITCYGDNDGVITPGFTGGTLPYSFNWSPNVADLNAVSAGTYNVTVTDANGCVVATDQLVFSQPDSITITLTPTDASSSTASDGAVAASVVGGVGSYTYDWSNSSNNATLTNIGAGNYCVTVTDANACTAAACATVSAPSGIITVNGLSHTLYPNPASSVITLQSEELKGATLRIFGTDGALKAEHILSANKENINLSELPQGVYTYFIVDQHKNSFISVRFVISR